MNASAQTQIKQVTAKIATLAHDVSSAKADEEKWASFVQLFASIQDLKRRQKKKKRNKEPERGVSNDDLDNLKGWLLKNGFSAKHLEAIDFAAHLAEGCGVIAKKDIEKGELFLQVPRKLMLSASALSNTPLGQLIRMDKFLSQSPSLSLALHLLYEKHNHSSFWAPYIKTLPRTYGTCLYFTLEEIEALRGSPNFINTVKIIATVASQYTYVHDLFQINKDIMHLAVFTWEEFIWAMSAVMSRQNQVPLHGYEAPPELVLIPAWDMCNHDHGEITTFYDANTDSTECYATRSYKKGEQVYIFYGARSNSNLLLHSGFVAEKNAYDHLDIRVRLSPDVSSIKGKLNLLHLNNMKMDSHYSLRGDGLPAELLAFFRICAMNDEEVQQALALSENKKEDENGASGERFNPLAKLNDANEQAAIQLALKKCQEELAKYPTTIDQDKKLLQSNSLSRNMRSVVLLRLKEKEILARTISAFQTNTTTTTQQQKPESEVAAPQGNGSTNVNASDSNQNKKKKKRKNKNKKNKNTQQQQSLPTEAEPNKEV